MARAFHAEVCDEPETSAREILASGALAQRSVSVLKASRTAREAARSPRLRVFMPAHQGDSEAAFIVQLAGKLQAFVEQRVGKNVSPPALRSRRPRQRERAFEV